MQNNRVLPLYLYRWLCTGSTYAPPANITLTASAADSDGTITAVEFYNGATLIGSVTTPPYTATWSNVPLGNYSVRARAVDNQGGATYSNTIAVNVNAVVASSVYYLYADHLNTPRVITDTSNKVVWRWDSDPFGADAANEDPDGDGTKFRYNPRFPGQYFDKETGLHYNYFRDYDPRTGRYVQSDPIGLEGGSFSTYNYARANPISFMDPDGLAFCWYSISSGRLICVSDNPPQNNPIALNIPVASGNNGGGKQCKDNPSCTQTSNRGPIPQGMWTFGAPGSSGKENGRRLTPQPGTNNYNRSLLASHSCLNAFGPSLRAPFCSEGCLTGSRADIQRLNRLIDTESRSTLLVTD